jgi:hypothetical protein
MSLEIIISALEVAIQTIMEVKEDIKLEGGEIC